MSHRKTFIGTILSVTQSKIIMSSQASPNSEPISLAAGAVVLEQARSLVGRTVRYTAELDTSTAELTRPQFVIGSEYGLRAQVVIRDRSEEGNFAGEGRYHLTESDYAKGAAE